jgi:hypothetical protein
MSESSGATVASPSRARHLQNHQVRKMKLVAPSGKEVDIGDPLYVLI